MAALTTPPSALIAIGSYTERMPFVAGRGAGITLFRLGSNGQLSRSCTIGPDVCGPNPTYMSATSVPSAGGNVLLVCNEVDDVARSSARALRLAADGASGWLLRAEKDPGTDACNTAVLQGGPGAETAAPRAPGFICFGTKEPHYGATPQLLVCNYADGLVCSYGLGVPSSILGPLSARLQLGKGITFPGAVPERQDGPHAHCALPLDASAALVCDLGSNVLWMIQRDLTSGQWAHPSVAFECLPGAGPRQAAHHPTRRLAYVVNELSSTVTPLALETGPTGWRVARAAPDVPIDPKLSGKPDVYGGALKLHAAGRWLYASLRARNKSCVVLFEIDERTGGLTRRASARTGETPRDFNLVRVPAAAPNAQPAEFCVVANQDGDSLQVFRLGKDGRLSAVRGAQVACSSPSCVTPLQPQG